MAPPIVVATLQSAVIAAGSNILAQVIAANRDNTKFIVDWIPVFQFFLYAAVNTPLNFVWQEFLESTFPSTHVAPTPQAIASAAADDDKALDRSAAAHELVEPRLNVANTVIKTVLDQTVGAVVNTLTFCLFVGGLQAAMAHNPPQSANPLFFLRPGTVRYEAVDWSRIMARTRADFAGILRAGWVFWPFVSVINFGFIKDVQTRNLVGSLAGVAWGVYMSLFAAQ